MSANTHYIQNTLNSQSGLLHLLENMPMVRIFNKNKIIYTQSDTADNFYYLKKGKVKIFIVSENGTEKTLSVIGKGAILGEASFFDGQPRMSSARALTRCELVSVSKNLLTEMIRRNPDTALELLHLQARTIRMLSAQIDSMSFIDAKGRIAQFLLQSADNTDTVYATHEEIASIVGVSRVTVSKLTSRLAEDEMIVTGYRSIKIQNKERLRHLYMS